MGDKATEGSEPSEPAYPNCTRIFNGVNFEGWEADPSTWSIPFMPPFAGMWDYHLPKPHNLTHPEQGIIPGPIGRFRHGGGASEYKYVYVESNPKENVLITVKAPTGTKKQP
jgi:hypothetical protein